jgi:MULE transposase domain
MLTSSGTSATISFFVSWVQGISPAVRPAIIMTDRDQAQIAALQAVYPKSQIYLCTWHVLRAIRSHFVTTEFPGLWDMIRKLVNTDDQATFSDLWDKISTDPSVPRSLVKYLATKWMPDKYMWSHTVRKDRSIYEEGHTNMLIEAYVNAFFI